MIQSHILAISVGACLCVLSGCLPSLQPTAAQGAPEVPVSSTDSLQYPRIVIDKGEFPAQTILKDTCIIDFCINPEGKVIYAKYNTEKSGDNSTQAVAELERYVSGLKFNRDPHAPLKQCNEYVIIAEAFQRR